MIRGNWEWCLAIAALAGACASACTPPPAAWPIAGAVALPDGATTVDGYVGAQFGEHVLGEPRNFGAGVRHQLSEDVSVGAGASVLGIGYAPFYQLRGYGRLQLAGDGLAAIAGFGTGTDFDGLDYGTADLALVTGIPLGVWEIYMGPGIAVSAPFDPAGRYAGTSTGYVGGAAGVLCRPVRRFSIGLEGMFAVVLPSDDETGIGWGGGLGAFARYLLDDDSDRDELARD